MKPMTSNRLANKINARNNRTARMQARHQTRQVRSQNRTVRLSNRRNTDAVGSIARNTAISVSSVAKQNRLAREAEAKYGASEAANLQSIFNTMYNDAKTAQESVTERGGGY